MPQIDLTLIILTYNSQFWLKKTLSTLKDFYLDKTKYTVKTIVVDNNSSDETMPMVRRSFRWVETIELPGNLGFAAGNNVALKKIESRYVMLLNSDMELTPDSNLDTLIEYMDQHDRVGIVSPRVEFTNGKIDPASHRGEPTPWAAITYFTKLESLFPQSRTFGQYHQFYKDLTSVHPIEACSGAAMMVRNDAIKKVGLLDERFFMYAEDLDWCRRFREAGYAIIYNPEVKIIHHKYKSGIKSASKKIATQTNKHFYDTMLQYYDKYYKNKYPGIVRSLIKYLVTIKKEGT